MDTRSVHTWKKYGHAISTSACAAQHDATHSFGTDKLRDLLLPPWIDSGEDCHHPRFAAAAHFVILTPQPPRF